MLAIDEIKSRVRTEILIEEIAGARPQGPDGQGRFMGLCPFHEDSHPSLRVFDSGGFKCFTCDAKGGDVIDFWARYRGLQTAAAIRELAERINGQPLPPGPVRAARAEPPPPSPPAVPIPEDRIPAVGTPVKLERPGEKPTTVTPSMIHVYRDREGVALALVIRAEAANGRKTFRPARWDGERFWAVAQDAPRSIYGLELVRPGQQVLVVEGEKACEAARRMAPAGLAVVTWAGGGNGVHMTDWGPLAGSRVVLWPDNDAPGRKAMDTLGDLLTGSATEIKIVTPTGLPEKGDAADLELEGDVDMVSWLRSRVALWQAPAEPASPKPEPAHEKTFATPEEVIAARDGIFPFHILGQHDGRAYFLKRADGRVVSHALTSLQRPEVLGTLAAPDVWRRAFGGTDADGAPIGWKVIGMAAQSHIVRAVEQLPEFDPQLTRGRGCWPHGAGIAWNRGDVLYVNGLPVDENYVDGKVYERGAPLPVDLADWIGTDEGNRLINVLGECNWSDGHAPILLAGWIALAPICGALQWRPHVWITGPHGSGKSTVLDEIVKPAIGARGFIRLAGNTSEAGLRQTINHDSLPVLLDETESESKSMKAIMDLSRSASTGDVIVRGSANQGGAHHYHIRSSFCFSAINTSIEKAADESRITRLFLVKRNGPDSDRRYLAMRDALANLMLPGWGNRLAARMIRMAPVVLDTIRLMEDAVTRAFGSRRLAQQYGALLAGAWCLTSDVAPTENEADAMASSYVPASQRTVETTEDDAARMLNHFLSFQVDIQMKQGRAKVAIGELVDRLATLLPIGSDVTISREEADDVLARWGVRVKSTEESVLKKEVHIAKNHPQLMRQLFKETAWVNSYADRFKDLEGARPGVQTRYAGGRYTAVIVPMERFQEEAQ